MKLIMAEHSHYQSLYRVGCHHLADYFVGQGVETLYLSGPLNIYNLRYFITGNPAVLELKYALKAWQRGGIQEASRLTSYSPMTVLPIWRRSIFATEWVARHTLDFTVPNIGRYIRRQSFAPADALLVSQPFFASLLETVPAQRKVYRLTDDIDKFPNMPASVRVLERTACQSADAVVVTATPLIEKVQSYGVQNIHYIPNGVDYDHYQPARQRPAEYGDMSGPIAVYMGALDSWFDIETLATCARRFPQVTFVLIGAARIDLSPLKSYSNVRYLGRRDYSTLPAYLQHADVGLIPFQVTPLVEAVSPLKLYEYMACGLPVVASRWRELTQTGSPAYLANDSASFVAGLEAALAENGHRREEYRAFARANAWASRGQQLKALFVC